MTTQLQSKPRVRLILLAYADVFLLYGAASLVFPEAVARLTEIQLSTASALADLRGLYGGLSLGLGALFLQCARKPEWAAPGLYVAMMCSVLPAAARLYSALVSGMPSALVVSFFAIELVSFAIVLGVYRGLSSGDSSHPHAAVQAVG